MGNIGRAVASVPGVVIVEMIPERRRREMLSSQLSGGIASNARRRQMMVMGERITEIFTHILWVLYRTVGCHETGPVTKIACPAFGASPSGEDWRSMELAIWFLFLCPLLWHLCSIALMPTGGAHPV